MKVRGQLHARPLYPCEKGPRYSLDMRLGRPSRSECDSEEKRSLHWSFWESNPARPVHNVVTILTESLRLSFRYSIYGNNILAVDVHKNKHQDV
jgi:hypothetical protein